MIRLLGFTGVRIFGFTGFIGFTEIIESRGFVGCIEFIGFRGLIRFFFFFFGGGGGGVCRWGLGFSLVMFSGP